MSYRCTTGSLDTPATITTLDGTVVHPICHNLCIHLALSTMAMPRPILAGTRSALSPPGVRTDFRPALALAA